MRGSDLTSLENIVHVIQTSLSPIFLLTAISGLLSVFTTRLARISDQTKLMADAAMDDGTDATRQRLAQLKLRSHALDVAVLLGAVGGACTCGTVLALFLGLVRANATGMLLLVLFGSAIVCTMGALGAFLTEMLLASRGVRAEVRKQTDEGLTKRRARSPLRTG